MRAFITGATGFIGRHLCARLQREGYHVHQHRRGESLENVKRVQPDVIFHLAAELYRTDRMFDSNVCLTYELLEASKDVDYQAFVYCGSSSEYGRKARPISETDELRPTTPYEATKGAAALLCQSYDKPITIVRPFSVYGPGEPEHRFIPTIHRCWATRAELALADGVHDWIYVEDFIEGMMLVARSGPRDIVNFGTGVQTTNSRLFEVFEGLVGDRIAVRHVGRMRPFDSESWVCDTRYAAEKYGFRAKVSLGEGLARYIESQAKNPQPELRPRP